MHVLYDLCIFKTTELTKGLVIILPYSVPYSINGNLFGSQGIYGFLHSVCNSLNNFLIVITK